MYAVIKTGGKQYKASEGEFLKVEKIEGNRGDAVSLDNVLMISKGGEIKVGTPTVEGAKVVGEIVGQMKASKVTVFKIKKRKGYRNKTGHRQKLTNLRIKKIVG